jgi:thiol-disulfide isomerase/thioredoxin
LEPLFHQNPGLSLFAAAALVCVASNSEIIEDTTLECFESAVVAVVVVGVVLLSSRPDVNQSRATLAGSVVFVDVVAIWCGSVEPVLEFAVEDALLGSELVELGTEVNQSRAALMGFRAAVDEPTVRVVDDGDVVDAVLLLFPWTAAENRGMVGAADISSSIPSRKSEKSSLGE